MSVHMDFPRDGGAEPMPERHHDEIVVPRPVVYLMIGMALFAVVTVSIGRWFDIGATHEGRLTEERQMSFRFRSPPIGQTPIAIVAHTGDGRDILLAHQNEEIFPRLILRSITNIRSRDGVSLDLPVELIETPDGQRLILDPATRTTMRLAAFGPENQHVFDPIFADRRS